MLFPETQTGITETDRLKQEMTIWAERNKITGNATPSRRIVYLQCQLLYNDLEVTELIQVVNIIRGIVMIFLVIYDWDERKLKLKLFLEWFSYILQMIELIGKKA